MPTNEERREIAARLRELARRKWTDRFPHWEEAILESWHSIRLLLGSDHTNPDKDHEEICNRLADLIEPEPEKTCRIKDMRCTRCGGNLDSYFHFSNEGSEWKIKPFCSWCGAKILNVYSKF